MIDRLANKTEAKSMLDELIEFIGLLLDDGGLANRAIA